MQGSQKIIMKKLTQFIKSCFRYFGFDIIRSLDNQIDLRVLDTNFENLARNYENLFGEKYGRFPGNETRIRLMKNLLGTPPSEAYFLVRFLYATKDIEGDVCEFGVAQGMTSKLIANEIKESSKNLHLFDSFEGLPEPTEKDQLKDDIFNFGSIQAYTGAMSNPQSSVRARLAELAFPENRYVIHKGFIEQLIRRKKSSLPTRVSFAYIDFDFFEPTLIALEYLHEVTREGTMLIVDDYDFFSTGVKTAVEEFIANHEEDYELFFLFKEFGHFAILTKK